MPVHDQVVELAPVDVLDELLQKLVDHRPAPDHGAAALDEEPDRDDAHAVMQGRDDLVAGLDGRGALGYAHHLRNRRAVDVGVQDADRRAQARQRGRQVGADRRLAHAPLARGDGDDVLDARQARIRRVIGTPEDLRREPHVDTGHAGQLAHRRFDRTGDDVARRAGGRRQLDADDRPVTLEGDRRHHSGRHEVDLQCGILGFAENGADVFFGYCHQLTSTLYLARCASASISSCARTTALVVEPAGQGGGPSCAA